MVKRIALGLVLFWVFLGHAYAQWAPYGAGGGIGSIISQYALTVTTTSTTQTTVEGVPCGATASQKYGYVEVINIKAFDTITGATAQWSAGPLVFSCTGGTPANALLSSTAVTAGPNTATTGSALYGAALPVISADTLTNQLETTFAATATNSTTWTVYVGVE